MIVRLSDPHTPASLRQLGNQIVVDFAGAEVASNLARRYDAGDFATPVTGFDVVRAGDGVRLAISATGDFEHLAYQSDDQYVVEVQPARKAAQKTEDKRIYTGERLTLNFQDIETRAVLQLLADASGQNIVVIRLGSGQRDAALAERAVGPGARHRPAHQGPRQAAQRQRDHRCAHRRTRLAREGRACRARGCAGSCAAAFRVSAGQLREGL